MKFLERDPFLQAYPVDITMGLIIGGAVTMLSSQDMVAILVGDIAVISGLFLTIHIALSFNGGTHCRRT